MVSFTYRGVEPEIVIVFREKKSSVTKVRVHSIRLIGDNSFLHIDNQSFEHR